MIQTIDLLSQCYYIFMEFLFRQSVNICYRQANGMKDVNMFTIPASFLQKSVSTVLNLLNQSCFVGKKLLLCINWNQMFQFYNTHAQNCYMHRVLHEVWHNIFSHNTIPLKKKRKKNHFLLFVKICIVQIKLVCEWKVLHESHST